MKYLTVSNCDANTVIVDDEDYDRLKDLSWHNTGTTIQHSVRIGRKIKATSLASIIMYKPGVVFDHINTKHTDNRKQNLRECSHSQNMANRKKTYFSSSMYKGVHWVRTHRKWAARIYCGKSIFLGYFDNEFDAAKAYDNAALNFFKEFANINFK